MNIFVKGLEGKSYIVTVGERDTVSQLWRKISVATLLKEDELRVLHGAKELRKENNVGQDNYLSDYGIQDQSTVFVVLRLQGGTKQYDRSIPLAKEPDMISLDDEVGGQRAKMPCGHVVGPDSLTHYCKSLLDDGKHQFVCPHKESFRKGCEQEWDLPAVKKFGVLSMAETNEFEVKLGENYLRKAPQIQECPRCRSFCERQSNRDQRVICSVCTKKDGGSRYEFCWFCLGKWNSGEIRGKCGNPDCTGVDPMLRLLKECPKKTIIGVENCPSIRACPKCGVLIEHASDCKHMECKCQQKFCFICLKKADDRGFYQCGRYNQKCEIAPIQTSIPNQ